MPKKVNVDKLRSKFEAEVLRGLQNLKKRKKYEVAYETEKISYVVYQTYLPDFIVTLKSGRKIYLEAKGYWDAADRRKLKLVKEQNPDLDIRLVFQANNKIHKNSNTRYSDYCDRHGITYSVGVIPEDWFV